MSAPQYNNCWSQYNGPDVARVAKVEWVECLKSFGTMRMRYINSCVRIVEPSVRLISRECNSCSRFGLVTVVLRKIELFLFL